MLKNTLNFRLDMHKSITFIKKTCGRITFTKICIYIKYTFTNLRFFKICYFALAIFQRYIKYIMLHISKVFFMFFLSEKWFSVSYSSLIENTKFYDKICRAMALLTELKKELNWLFIKVRFRYSSSYIIFR